jgi:hypothetical protein
METYTATKASRDGRRGRFKGKKERRMRQQQWRSEKFNFARELSHKYKDKQDQRIRNRRADKMGWGQPIAGTVNNHATNDNDDSDEIARDWDIHIALLAWDNHILRTEQDNVARAAELLSMISMLSRVGR